MNLLSDMATVVIIVSLIMLGWVILTPLGTWMSRLYDPTTPPFRPMDNRERYHDHQQRRFKASRLDDSHIVSDDGDLLPPGFNGAVDYRDLIKLDQQRHWATLFEGPAPD